MIKTALLIITMSGYGTVYENPYPTIESCLADRKVVASQIDDRESYDLQVLCVPDVNNQQEIWSLFDKFMDRIPHNNNCKETSGDFRVWNETNGTRKNLCSQE